MTHTDRRFCDEITALLPEGFEIISGSWGNDGSRRVLVASIRLADNSVTTFHAPERSGFALRSPEMAADIAKRIRKVFCTKDKS